MSSWVVPPSLKAIINDANRVAPNRSHASDGTIGDTRHQQQGALSDHNPDSHGIVHAVDVTNDPANGMDTWHWAQIIASRMVAGLENRVEYLVSNDGHKDVIFHPGVSNTWRQNGSVKQEHTNHLHTSIKHTFAAENDVSEYFVDDSPGPVIPPVQKELEMSNSVWYKNDNYQHTMWINNDGDWMHNFNPNQTENFSTKYLKGTKFDKNQPVVMAIHPTNDNVIFTRAIDVKGNIVCMDYQPSTGWGVHS